MFLSQLFESTIKHASFCFGRMNPPTLGHGQLIDTVAQASQGGDYFVFASGTQDKKKNPLDYATKIKFLRALFPEQANHIVNDPTLKTIMQVAEWLYAQGYRSVTFVAGSDRLDSFKQLLTSYNGVEGKNVYYKFDSINFVSSGERDPDADGIAGISASGAREAAVNGDVQAFAQATGAGKLTQPLYDAVRKGMMLTDLELAESADTVIPHYLYKWVDGPQFQKYIDAGKLPVKRKYAHYIDAVNKLVPGNSFTDEAHINKWVGNTLIRIDTSKLSNNIYPIPGNRTYLKTMGMTNSSYDPTSYKYESEEIDEYWIEGPVDISSAEIVQGKAAQPELVECSGYIPKNKKEARDPRWSNSLTVDIKPGAINKNLKALRLI